MKVAQLAVTTAVACAGLAALLIYADAGQSLYPPPGRQLAAVVALVSDGVLEQVGDRRQRSPGRRAGVLS